MKFLALIALLLIGATSQAATVEIGTPKYIRPVGDQLWYFPGNERESPRPAWPGMENNPRDINVPTSKGRLPVTVNQKTPVSLNKLGTAATNLAKRVGPVALGLGVAGLLCDLELICSSPEQPNTWAVREPEVIDPVFPPTVPQGDIYSPGSYPTPSATCSGIAAHSIYGQYIYGEPTEVRPYGYCHPENAPAGVGLVNVSKQPGVCPSGYTLQSGICVRNGYVPQPDGWRPVTPDDWDRAGQNPGLHSPDIIPDLIEGGEPIPVDTPTIEPKTVPGPGGSTTETIRNGQGQPIGTKTTDTTVTVSPSGPTTVNVTETTTITETNITNNTTTTTTQETTLPNNEDQSEKPQEEDQDIEIDNVQDQDLEEYEVPDTFDHESWGGGSCPGDQAISVMGKSITVPIHHICDGLAMLRPVVLIIAFLAAAYIMSGAIRQ